MQVRISIRAPKSFPQSAKSAIRKAIRATLRFLPAAQMKTLSKRARTFEVTFSIVGTHKMRQLNSNYRKKNRPTDVLSFSRLETQMPYQPILEIGDCVICLPVAKQQAKRFRQSLNLELQRLTVHGLLHLFGYDHEKSKKEERKMFSLQDAILESLSPRHLKT